MSFAKPSASGALSGTPLAALVAVAWHQKMSGRLELRSSDGLGALWFAQGSVVDAHPPRGRSAEDPNKTTLHSSPQELRSMIINCSRILFTLPGDCTYAFFDGAVTRPERKLAATSPSVEPHTLLWRGLRDNPMTAHLDATLSKLGRRTFRVTDTKLDAYEFESKVRAVVDLLRTHSMSLESIVGEHLLTKEEARPLTYLLLLMKGLEVDALPSALPAQAPSQAIPSMPAPSQAIPSMPAPSQAIPSMPAPSQAIPSMQPVPSIPVPSTQPMPSMPIPSQAIPSTQPAPLPVDPKSLRATVPMRVPAVFAPSEPPSRLNLNTRSLPPASSAFDPEGPSTVVSRCVVAAPPPSRAPDSPATEAAKCFRLAEHQARRSEWTDAEALCRRAVEGDRKAPYLALLAWITAQQADGQGESATQASIVLLDEAINMEMGLEKAFVYRAALHKRLGRSTLAIRDLHRAIELNPANAEAVRDLRALEARSAVAKSRSIPPPPTSAPAPPASAPSSGAPPSSEKDKGGGFLGRYFKKG